VTPEDLPAGHDGRVNQGLAMTDYFSDQVMCKRPYIKLEWCREALDRPVRREV
jgi:hypothetical protein